MFKKVTIVVVVLALLMVVGSVFAAWDVDEYGYGFVGKGDVQLIYGWNNKDLQDNAVDVEFRIISSSVTETTWTCDRDSGPQTQERTNTTTTTTQEVVTTVARVRNQITGFLLEGFMGDPTETSESDGPDIGSCPAGWTAIDLTDTTYPGEDNGVQVSINGTDWFELPPQDPIE
jgi:hypothetical protein